MEDVRHSRPIQRWDAFSSSPMTNRDEANRGGVEHTAAYNVVFFITLLATALSLGAALAHAFSLPNKIDLSSNEYFITQKAYRGWSHLAYVLAVQFVSMTTLAIMARRDPYIFWPVIVALGCLIGAQALFWVFTFPANVATQNWTVVPDNWESVRRQWEYSNAGGAAFQLLAMIALVVAVLASAGNGGSGGAESQRM